MTDESSPNPRVQALREEANALLYVLRDVDVLQAYQTITPPIAHLLRTRYHERLQAVYAEASGFFAAPAVQQPWSPPPAPAVGQAPAMPPRAPRPSLSNLAADNAILVVSSIGGVLLILAALLFELYGAGSFGESARFFVVAGVTALFGLASRFAWRREALRIVGKTYLAVFSLLVPITVAAAYEFLPLRQAGLTADVTATLGGIGCAVLYAALGIRIRSREYAIVGVIAGSVACSALLHASGVGMWWGSATGALAIAISSIDRLPIQNTFRQLVEKATGAVTVLALGTGICMTLATSAEAFRANDSWQALWLLFTSLTIVGAVMIRRGARTDESLMTLSLTAATTAALLACWLVQGAPSAYALVLVGSAAIWAGLARVLPRVRSLISVGSAFLVVVSATISLADDRFRLLVLAGGALVSLILALHRREQGWLLASYAAFGVALLQLSPELSGAAFNGHPLLALAVLVLAICAGIMTWGRWAREMVGLTALTFNAALFAFDHSINGGWLGAGVMELASGTMYIVASSLFIGPARLRTSLTALGLMHVCISVLLPYNGSQAHAIIGVLACTAALAPALVWRHAVLTLVPAGLFSIAWYWIVPAVVPPPANAGFSTLALAYSPLPLMLLAIAGAVRFIGARRTPWSVPCEVTAGAAAAWTLLLAASSNAQTILIIDLLVFAAGTYAVSAWEGWSRGVIASATLSAIGVATWLNAVNAPSYSYSVALAFSALVMYMSGWLYTDSSLWSRMHRFAGIAVAIVAATLPEILIPHEVAANQASDLAAFLAAIGLSACLFMESQFNREVPTFWAGVAVIALALDWISASLLWINPQTYVIAPALTAVAGGWILMQKPRPWVTSERAAFIAGLGLTALIGTTVMQSFSPDASASMYSAIGVGEGVAAVLLGIAMAHRTSVVVGGAALGLLGLHALYQVMQEVPLYVMFGAAAMVLICIGAVMATARPRVTAWRDTAARSWESWH